MTSTRPGGRFLSERRTGAHVDTSSHTAHTLSRGRTRTSAPAHSATGTQGLINARTRIVGTRTDPLADALVALVRLATAFGAGAVRMATAVAGVVTPLGWSIVGLVVVGFTVGYGLGWLELVAVAWVGVVLVVAAVLSLLARNSFEIGVFLPSTRVVVGERAPAQLTVHNPTARRLVGVTVEVPVGGGLAEFAVPSLRPGSSFEDVFVVPTTRRGVIRIGPVRTVRGDPVGLLRREITGGDPIDLYVHPRTIPVPSTSTGFVRDLEGNPTRDLANSDVSFHALREYLPGDERRHIHWRSTAKTGVHMVRQFEETRRSHLMIALSLASSDYSTEEEFELAVSVAASLGVRAIRDARNVSVVASERTPEFAKRKVYALKRLSVTSRPRLLDDLSTVHHAATALPIPDLARVAADSVAGISVAFVVCGTGATKSELRAASTKFPAGVEVVAVVCDPGMTPALRRVSELSVLTIGYLEDLTRSLSRSAAA
ncbi:DUF58 domain-containing protein [Planctomonas psychrotolerans]|uniref:DUF58 domain-containing protein n=1 Tax=Planctomonas psychrotolerans TaxID=2528712 RepID=UPI001D0D367F|nr:DUF58 domain-containing protein [Planctomonas psychrotolerans]